MAFPFSPVSITTSTRLPLAMGSAGGKVGCGRGRGLLLAPPEARRRLLDAPPAAGVFGARLRGVEEDRGVFPPAAGVFACAHTS